jgi:hypothetical protein
VFWTADVANRLAGRTVTRAAAASNSSIPDSSHWERLRRTEGFVGLGFVPDAGTGNDEVCRTARIWPAEKWGYRPRSRTLVQTFLSGPPSILILMIFGMDQYCCRAWDLPPFLYRVQYPESQTCRIDGGLEAADTTTSFGPGQLDEFRRTVQNHFTWGYRGRSPFISLFSDWSHAES